jgi:hypothetical protein
VIGETISLYKLLEKPPIIIEADRRRQHACLSRVSCGVTEASAVGETGKANAGGVVHD